MKRWLRVMCVLGALIPVLAPARAEAIPVFARRYQTACTTCHVLIPKLNAFGIAFRNNGYRIPANDEKFVKTPDVPLGAPGWKKVWPDAVWPGGIPGMSPLAFRLLSDGMVNPSAPVKLDFDFPHELEFLTGGTAGSSVSFWGEVALEPSGGETEVDIERAFAQFDGIGGTTLANVVVGRFEPRAVPFSRFWRRLTSSDFVTSSFRAVSGGFNFQQRQQGFEFWGAKSGAGGKGGVEYAAGVVNGSGAQKDNNTRKDYYYRFAYKFGGFGLTGTAEELAELQQANNWRDNSVKVGTSGYFGKGIFDGKEDEFWRFGADVDAFIQDLNVYAAVVRGRDKLTATREVKKFTSAFVQGDYVIKPWIIGSVRYDAVFREGGKDVKRVVPAVIFAIRANVRVVAEAEQFLNKSGDSRGRIRLDIDF